MRRTEEWTLFMCSLFEPSLYQGGTFADQLRFLIFPEFLKEPGVTFPPPRTDRAGISLETVGDSNTPPPPSSSEMVGTETRRLLSH